MEASMLKYNLSAHSFPCLPSCLPSCCVSSPLPVHLTLPYLPLSVTQGLPVHLRPQCAILLPQSGEIASMMGFTSEASPLFSLCLVQQLLCSWLTHPTRRSLGCCCWLISIQKTAVISFVPQCQCRCRGWHGLAVFRKSVTSFK